MEWSPHYSHKKWLVKGLNCILIIKFLWVWLNMLEQRVLPKFVGYLVTCLLKLWINDLSFDHCHEMGVSWYPQFSDTPMFSNHIGSPIPILFLPRLKTFGKCDARCHQVTLGWVKTVWAWTSSYASCKRAMFDAQLTNVVEPQGGL
jgi:hypothetical protein